MRCPTNHSFTVYYECPYNWDGDCMGHVCTWLEIEGIDSSTSKATEEEE